MTRTTVFKNNTTQAVRLPKDVALPDRQMRHRDRVDRSARRSRRARRI
ncbi:hypothetical protein [Marihabitans asiaticum]|nr:hypothetical protein [Marihabitans asiaticum]